MPERTRIPTGAPCWIDLSTSDASRSRAFYGDLFGWVADEPDEEFGGYFTFRKDGVPVAGCMAAELSANRTDTWSVYLATDDAQKTVDLAAAHGGSVHVPPMQVGEAGTMALLADAGGALVGLWQPGRHRGFEVHDEPGSPGWFELHTRDYDASIAFYRDVLGWDARVMSDVPEFRYTTLMDGEEQIAGIMDATQFLPDGVPAHWSVYFAVADADAALERAVQLGGQVVVPAETTPYGRLATATDATGAPFKLVAPPTA